MPDDTLPLATVHRLPTNPWAIAGLHSLDDLPDRHLGDVWNSGFIEWNSKLHLARGTLSVVTGLPGSGKTHFWAQVWKYVVEKYNLVALIASFECAPKPYYRRYLREMHAGKREHQMSDDEIAVADRFIAAHYRFLVHPEETPTLDWILDMADLAVERERTSIIQIDPWNRLESQRGQRETEPDYVLRCLRSCSVFAKDRNAHFQIMAHPAKREARRRDIPPELEDIAGAMHWWNVPDQGFVVHRDELWNAQGGRCYDATLYHRKARFEELGYPCALEFRFNWHTRMFEVVSKQDAATEEPAA